MSFIEWGFRIFKMNIKENWYNIVTWSCKACYATTYEEECQQIYFAAKCKLEKSCSHKSSKVLNLTRKISVEMDYVFQEINNNNNNKSKCSHRIQSATQILALN